MLIFRSFRVKPIRKYQLEPRNKNYVTCVIFVRGIDDNFNVIEKLSAFFSKKVQTRGVDILQVLKNVLQNNRLGMENLAGVATDGPLSMIDWHSGLITLLKKVDEAKSSIVSYHCTIYCKFMCQVFTV